MPVALASDQDAGLVRLLRGDSSGLVRMSCPVTVFAFHNFLSAQIHRSRRLCDHGDTVFDRANLNAEIAGDAFDVGAGS